MLVSRDVIGGVVLIVAGALFFLGTMDLRVGTIMSMGPGYFPRAVAVLVMFSGLGIVIMGALKSERVTVPEWRPAAAVLAAVAVFALTIRQLGLAPAMFFGVVIASLGDRTARPWSTVALALIAALGAWLIFRVGLGLQLPGWRLPTFLR